jgi:hypothetical protein
MARLWPSMAPKLGLDFNQRSIDHVPSLGHDSSRIYTEQSVAYFTQYVHSAHGTQGPASRQGRTNPLVARKRNPHLV